MGIYWNTVVRVRAKVNFDWRFLYGHSGENQNASINLQTYCYSVITLLGFAMILTKQFKNMSVEQHYSFIEFSLQW